ncbi:MAG TPA: helix-turn-helix transcriptional regulator [Pseudobacteroides sp.]|nr:helix-turn-helix transcriptional regulator [Pseudobacteroides sp.]
MAISYKKLFHVMIEKGISNSQLQKQAGFSANIITRLKRNEYVSLESIESICRVLNCKVDDILEFVPDQNLVERMWMDTQNMGTYDFVKFNTE